MLFASQVGQVMAVPYYQMTLGVDPFLLSLALAFPVLVATLIAPLVGHFSDSLHCRWGRRRPLIALGVMAASVSFGLLWMVPVNWQTQSQLAYFSGLYLVFFLCVTVANVPMTSLSYELSHREHERQSIMVINTYFIKVASVLYQWSFPLAGMAIFGGIAAGIKVTGWMIAIVAIGLMGLLPVFICREQVTVKTPPTPTRLRSCLHLLTHPGVGWLMVLCLLQLGGSVMAASMDYYLLVYAVSQGDVSQGAVLKGVLSTSYAVVGLLSVPLVSGLVTRYGKESALQIVLWLTLFGGVIKWFLFVPGAGYWVALDAFFCCAIWTAMSTVVPMCNAQLSDRHTALTGKQEAGMFSAIFHSTASLAGIVALVGSGALLNAIQFDAQRGAAQTTTTILMMRLILSGGTVLVGVLSLLCLRYYRRAVYKNHCSQAQ